jgi:hypothetical protein
MAPIWAIWQPVRAFQAAKVVVAADQTLSGLAKPLR